MQAFTVVKTKIAGFKAFCDFAEAVDERSLSSNACAITRFVREVRWKVASISQFKFNDGERLSTGKGHTFNLIHCM